MAAITTRRDQRSTASAARKVGGYSELVRLAAEKAERGKGSSVEHDRVTGKWVVKSAKK